MGPRHLFAANAAAAGVDHPCQRGERLRLDSNTLFPVFKLSRRYRSWQG